MLFFILARFLHECEMNNNVKDVKEMLSNIGIPGLILILVLALIIFGPKKLPEIGRAVGQTLQEFKKSARELTNEAAEDVKHEINEVKEERNNRKEM